jgi:hypothetical protein
MLHKIYGAATGAGDKRRYSPAIRTGIDKRVITGEPDKAKVSTSYVERQNLTMRMGMRRFTRLPNGFSKKAENLAHAVSLHYMHYNFARLHKTLTKARNCYPTTPVWRLESLTTCGPSWRSPDCSTSPLSQTDPLPTRQVTSQVVCGLGSHGCPAASWVSAW